MGLDLPAGEVLALIEADGSALGGRVQMKPSRTLRLRKVEKNFPDALVLSVRGDVQLHQPIVVQGDKADNLGLRACLSAVALPDPT
jgi:hypothetical protein